jgi:hypothetical protein
MKNLIFRIDTAWGNVETKLLAFEDDEDIFEIKNKLSKLINIDVSNIYLITKVDGIKVHNFFIHLKIKISFL